MVRVTVWLGLRIWPGYGYGGGYAPAYYGGYYGGGYAPAYYGGGITAIPTRWFAIAA